MNDHDVLSVVRDGLSTIDMDTPAETLIATGNARRRIRRLYGVAAVLNKAGVPALVRVGTFCHSRTDPPGLNQALTARAEGGTVVLVITPSAIPSGAQLSFGFKPQSDPGTKERVQVGLIWSSGPQLCETFE